DALGHLEQLRLNDLQMGQFLGAALAAPQDACIGQIADDASDGGVVPHLPCSGPVALPVQVSSDPLCAVALVDVLFKNSSYHGGLALIDHQIVKLMFALVEAPAFDQIIAIRGEPALEAARLDELTQGGLGTDGSLFALSVGLPETDVIGELVGVAVKTLLAFLGAPYLDPLLDEPFHHKGRFICNAPDAVKHEHQQDVELFLPGQI